MSQSFQKKFYHERIENKLHPYEVVMYGSCVNGLNSKQSSDLDLTIIYNDLEYSHEDFLNQVNNVVRKYGIIKKTIGTTN